MSYADDYLIDIRYMIEIAIIGSIFGILFNAADYSTVMQIVFVVLGLGSAVIYHIFYNYDGPQEKIEIKKKHSNKLCFFICSCR